MSRYQSGINRHINEIAAGQCAIVAALVIALHEKDVLRQDRYREILDRLWAAMPEEEAIGEAGAVIERLFDLLDTGPCTTSRCENVEQKQEKPTTAGNTVSDDVMARPHNGFTPTTLGSRARVA